MKIENLFTIDAPVQEAWVLLTDIPGIAPCLPGANLSGEEAGVYSGAVKIKVGPVTAEYRGTAEFVERDDDHFRAVIDSKGRDSRGAGNAQALITAEMKELGGQTQVHISTDLKITGKVAQFGRGVMQDVSEKLLAQFAQCLAAKLEGTDTLEAIASKSAELGSPEAHHTTEGDGEALDLLDVAGGAVFKRLIPAAIIVAIVAVALIVLLT